MGAAASIDSATQAEARQMVEVLKTSNDYSERLKILTKFRDWLVTVSKRIPLCHPSLGFVDQLARLLPNAKGEEMEMIISCFIKLTIEDENVPAIGKRDLGIGKELVRLFPQTDEQVNMLFNNIVLCHETHSYLLSTEVGLVEHLLSRMRDCTTKETAEKGFMKMKCLANIAMNLKDENVALFLSYKPEVEVCSKLKMVPKSEITGSAIALWSLNCLMGLSHFPPAVPLIKAQDGVTILKDRMNPNTRNGLKCAIAIANLTGRDEGSSTRESFIHSSPETFDLLLLLLHSTLTKGQLPETKKLRDMGFQLGTTQIRNIVGIFRTLSISDTNKPPLLKSNTVSLLVEALYLFTSDAPSLICQNEKFSNDAGGGGKDAETASLCIEALLQLSFNYETNEQLTKKFVDEVPGFSLISILTDCVADPRGMLQSEAKRNASSLLNKLKPTPTKDTEMRSAAPTATVASSVVAAPANKKHIMLSYSWAVNKSLVIAFGQRLRELGHDVWRDEEGSNILGPMSGDTDEMMAAAIEASHTVVVFVSPQYKESANCRTEAKYAKQRQLMCPLKILYVMMCENYHTRSNPPVDGWLALNIGTDMWYPLWSDAMVNTTAQSIADNIGHVSMSAAASGSPPKAMSLDQPSPVRATSVSLNTPLTPSAAVNWGAAWTLVSDPHCATDGDAVKNLLSDMGIDDQSDFETLAKADLVRLGELLKLAKRNKFNIALCL